MRRDTSSHLRKVIAGFFLFSLLVGAPVQAAAPAAASQQGSQIVVRTEPSQPLGAIRLRSPVAGAAAPIEIAVKEGKAVIPRDLPLPWAIEVEGFETVSYTAADAQQHRPIVLRALGRLRGRLELRGRNDREKFSWLLKRSDLPAPQEIEIEVSADGRFEIPLPGGIYQGAVLGKRAASKIRSGLVIRPGQTADAGAIACEPTVEVSFRVLDAKSRAPIPGAVVAWDPPEIENAGIARLLFARAWSSVTDRRGAVAFPSVGPLPIPLRWRVEAKGFARAVTARVLLREEQKAFIPDVLLRSEAEVVARVAAPRGVGVPSGVIVLQEPDPGNPARYLFKESRVLREGDTKFKLTSYGPKRLLLKSSSGQALCYRDVELSSETTIVEFHLEPVVINGSVTRSGKPVEEAAILLHDPHNAEVMLAKATSGSAGEYRLTTYQTGHLLVYAIAGAPGTNSGSSKAELDVSKDRREYEVNFELTTGSLTVLVTDASTGLPILHAQVSSRLKVGEGLRMGGMETDEGGRAVWSNYAEGTADLQVRAKGYRAREVSLPIQSSGGEYRIQLEPSPGVSGLVVDSQGRPVAGARISGGYADYLSQALFETRTDAAGRFKFDAAPPSGTTFYVAASGFALTLAGLAPGQENRIPLSPPSPGLVSVVTEKGGPSPNLRVAVAPGGGVLIPPRALNDEAEVNGMTFYQLLATGRDGVCVLPQFLEPGVYDFCCPADGRENVLLQEARNSAAAVAKPRSSCLPAGLTGDRLAFSRVPHDENRGRPQRRIDLTNWKVERGGALRLRLHDGEDSISAGFRECGEDDGSVQPCRVEPLLLHPVCYCDAFDCARRKWLGAKADRYLTVDQR